MHPFWMFFGSKWRLAPKYPAPRYSTIIEPFAGAAGYSVRRGEHGESAMSVRAEENGGRFKLLAPTIPIAICVCDWCGATAPMRQFMLLVREPDPLLLTDEGGAVEDIPTGWTVTTRSLWEAKLFKHESGTCHACPKCKGKVEVEMAEIDKRSAAKSP